MDPVEKFFSRAEDYVRYRPSYPSGVLHLLVRECGLTASSTVADIGAGTGMLSALFLDFGCQVVAVEPNSEMRSVAERQLAGYPHFQSVDGRAESTSLADSSVDFVTAAQAFHWFDPEPTRAEFRRILRRGGWTVLVWNQRVRAPGVMDGYESIVDRYGPEHAPITGAQFDVLYGVGNWRRAALPNRQSLDFEGLRGRFLSSSYAPLPGSERYQPLLNELRDLFDAHEVDGRVEMLYETEIYYGRI